MLLLQWHRYKDYKHGIQCDCARIFCRHFIEIIHNMIDKESITEI